MQTEDIKPAIFCVHCLPHSHASRTGELVSGQIIMCYLISNFSEHLIRVTLYFQRSGQSVLNSIYQLLGSSKRDFLPLPAPSEADKSN